MNITKEEIKIANKLLNKGFEPEDFFKCSDNVKIFIFKTFGKLHDENEDPEEDPDDREIDLIHEITDEVYFNSGDEFKKYYLKIIFKYGEGLSKCIYKSLSFNEKKEFIDSQIPEFFKYNRDYFYETGLDLSEWFVDEIDTSVIKYYLEVISEIEDEILKRLDAEEALDYKEFLRICKLKCL